MADESSSLLKALHAVQASAPTLTKDAEGQVGSRHYKYTPLDTIVEKIGPLLTENGLVWSTRPGGTHDEPILHYRLTHAETGEEMGGAMPLMIGENPTSQALGSAITYARRYALTALLNLVADEDDDGSAAQGYGRAASKPAGTFKSGGGPSDAQRREIKRLIASKHMSKDEIEVATNVATGKKLEVKEGWIEYLTPGRDGTASQLISYLKEFPVPTGRSDVPSDTSSFDEQLKHDVEGGAQGDPVPFDETEKS